jgi:hypothetical protein
MFGFGKTARLEGLLKKTEELYEKAVNESADKLEKLLRSTSELQTEKQRLTEEVERLKLDAKIKEEDIKHMVKMKGERQELEFKKRVMDVEKEKADAIARIKDENRDKMEERLIKEGDNIKEMYSEILKRLPDVNVSLRNTFEDKS